MSNAAYGRPVMGLPTHAEQPATSEPNPGGGDEAPAVKRGTPRPYNASGEGMRAMLREMDRERPDAQAAGEAVERSLRARLHYGL